MACTHFSLVVLESPYTGDIQRHVQYARACLRDSLSRGESPIASHLLLTQPGVFHDAVRGDRAAGIAAGHAWIAVADALVVYSDLGVSAGMEAGIREATRVGITIARRWLGAPWSTRDDNGGDIETYFVQPSTTMLGRRRHRGVAPF